MVARRALFSCRIFSGFVHFLVSIIFVRKFSSAWMILLLYSIGRCAQYIQGVPQKSLFLKFL